MICIIHETIICLSSLINLFERCCQEFIYMIVIIMIYLSYPNIIKALPYLRLGHKHDAANYETNLIQLKLNIL